jgi:hypothetical protein
VGVQHGYLGTAAAPGWAVKYEPPDPTKIEPDPEALHFWARTLETDENRLRKAVKKVGPLLEDVKKELGIAGV